MDQFGQEDDLKPSGPDFDPRPCATLKPGPSYLPSIIFQVRVSLKNTQSDHVETPILQPQKLYSTLQSNLVLLPDLVPVPTYTSHLAPPSQPIPHSHQ
ncbi:hypothetical protein POX_b02852 [Penicillium oxalicum]|uniref:hypothetical protein n=1 Tax=Penicillium oxalicum TaxID=69781 RepID=UPI0020B80C8D|nr:hypothetical protein POX_b02852 [Penicillium oxalicum]KAI2792809.1 hypothetical protein POX_b02852 [Penicillium oxalicum]